MALHDAILKDNKDFVMQYVFVYIVGVDLNDFGHEFEPNPYYCPNWSAELSSYSEISTKFGTAAAHLVLAFKLAQKDDFKGAIHVLSELKFIEIINNQKSLWQIVYNIFDFFFEKHNHVSTFVKACMTNPISYEDLVK